MLRRDRQIRMQLHQLADACLFAASFWLAFVLRTNPQVIAALHLEPILPDAFEQTGWLYFGLILAAPLILESQGFYNRPVYHLRRVFLWPLFKGCLITTVGLVLIMYSLHMISPRGVMIFFGVISFSMVWLKEEALRFALRSKLARSQNKRRFILIGTGDETARLRRDLKERHDESIEVVAALNLRDISVQELVVTLHEYSANGVIISAKHAYFERVESVIKICELEGVEAWLIADFFGTQISRAEFDEWSGHPLLIFRTAPETSWAGLVKQFLDLAGALLLLVVFSWLFALIAIVIKLTSAGPVFFRQKRSGLNGAPFTLYKFRTMVSNAEQFKHELAAMNEMSGPVFKLTNDPRVTPVGKFLRKFSLDELPQLFNVLRTEMSLVGPRPLPVDEVKRFNDLAHRRRLSVKPGLTCLWQVSGRNQITDFDDWVRLDLEYIDNWSLWLDLKILFRTIPVVLRGTGAK
jgi:exopolysaccharide biosynthesis polyprenyl glycosylphosphotransferase